MKKEGVIVTFLFLLWALSAKPQMLKSVVYDFDGLDVGQTDLPEGDYAAGDISYLTTANPLPASDMLGDRVLQLNANWSSGNGVFGRGISRFIEFDPNADRFNFFFYNPYSNNQYASFSIILTDDDDQNNYYDYFSDDCWQKSVTITPSGEWQFVSIPLKDFADANTGGNGAFDISFSQNKGMLLLIEFQFSKTAGAGNGVFYMDMLSFSEGNLPCGSTEFELPYKDPWDHCALGAYMHQARGQEQTTGPDFENLFPPGKKIKFINYFLDWSLNGSTVPNELPGNEISAMLADGYTPVITWEPLFEGYARLDPVQPRLQNIINGDYNTYIDAFASRVKTFNGPLIIRLMHEFEGDWYPWSISQNNKDPNQYVIAYRTIVNRFRAMGVTNVQWMWCVNSDYAPYAAYNWIVPAYPGDGYVDIIATDIYNSHFPVNSPFWRSFRSQAAESYYYLNKYFPQKPLYICEIGCRERLSWENTASQSKGAWYERMDKEIQSNFHRARALIFFNAAPDQNWFVNSSPFALQSLTDNVWNDPYYFPESFGIGSGGNDESDLFIFPNPATELITVNYTLHGPEPKSIRISNCLGEIIHTEELGQNTGFFTKQFDLADLARGVYFVEIIDDKKEANRKRRAKKLLIY